jgi:hypothetical protein
MSILHHEHGPFKSLGAGPPGTLPIANPICSRHINLQADPALRQRQMDEREKSTVRLAIRNRSCPRWAARIDTQIQHWNRGEDCYV